MTTVAALELKVGMHVALLQDEGEPMVTGTIPAGSTGTIVLIEDEDSNEDARFLLQTMGAQFFLKIKMDETFDGLDEWNNELHLLIDLKYNDANETLAERLETIEYDDECDALPTV